MYLEFSEYSECEGIRRPSFWHFVKMDDLISAKSLQWIDDYTFKDQSQLRVNQSALYKVYESIYVVNVCV